MAARAEEVCVLAAGARLGKAMAAWWLTAWRAIAQQQPVQQYVRISIIFMVVSDVLHLKVLKQRWDRRCVCRGNRCCDCLDWRSNSDGTCIISNNGTRPLLRSFFAWWAYQPESTILFSDGIVFFSYNKTAAPQISTARSIICKHLAFNLRLLDYR